MKTVIFMRHGKAANYFEYDSDFERPLIGRGKLEVKLAAEKLKAADIVPDIIVSRPAFRTASTARICADVFGIDAQSIQFVSSLYMGESEDYLKSASETKGTVILICGHNPATGNLAIHFGKGTIHNYPTSSIAAFEFTGDIITPQSESRLLFYDTRKN
jgi:phosphohistidine phosphatase